MTDPRQNAKSSGLVLLLNALRGHLQQIAGARQARVEARLRQQIKNADIERSNGVATLIGRRPLVER